MISDFAEIAPPKVTGGGGFVFEDQVCAWFFVCMLTGEPPLEQVLGRIDQRLSSRFSGRRDRADRSVGAAALAS